MKPYKKILIAIDDSDSSIITAEHGLNLCSQLGASCAIVFVIDTTKIREGVYSEILPKDQTLKLKKKANDTLNIIATQFPEHIFVRFTPENTPSKGIITTAEDWAADLIVIGTLGKTGLKRIFLGSTAENTIRLSPIPILVVPSKT